MSIDIVVWSAELPALSLLNIKINYHKWTSLITRVSFSTLPQYMQNYTVYMYVYILFYMFEVMYVFRGLGIVVVRLLDN